MKKPSGPIDNPSCILDELDLRLPTYWNHKDKDQHIEIGRNGLDLAYAGQGKDDSEAACVRANFPMRSQCGIYYFEMQVISRGDEGYIGIGFCTGVNDLDRLPGWDIGSWGYHGDDGQAFAGCGTGKGYGPCFTTGDVIGCGVNFADKTAFYTKNGVHLGTAFHSINTTAPLFPCIGLRSPGELVTVNFGQDAFMFDIAQYVKDQKTEKWKTFVDRQDAPQVDSVPKIESDQMKLDQLILSYLVHHGYTGTAKAFLKDKKYVCDTSLSIADVKPACFAGKSSDITAENDMNQRQSIRAALLAGQVDRAMELTQTYFPGVLDEQGKGENIVFELKCRKFIEMISEYTEQEHALRRKSQAANTLEDDRMSISSTDMQSSVCSEEPETVNGTGRRKPIPICTSPSSSSAPVSASGRRLSYAAIAASVSPTSSTSSFCAISVSPTGTASSNGPEPMEADEGISMVNRRGRRLSTRRSSSSSSSSSFSICSIGPISCEPTLGEEDEDDNNFGHTSTVHLMKQVMKYGQQLQESYRKSDKPRVRERLAELFSLFAYPDPSTSPVAYLLDKSGRDTLATELNAAILVHQNHPEIPPLERVFRQYLVSRKELVLDGHGAASLVSAEEQCPSHSLCGRVNTI
ncbi:hypothetical protein EC973_002428 [Apophysomyces ossiformis]|uniref:Ran-binding protein 10 n=1 Tax=Apophysomyces ossiformis TaxID=679940 RepID=A0A8H7ELQ0_9FUNG|nr:hypothetical protein EC973_002428 [Apophysomyces ossiformis]